MMRTLLIALFLITGFNCSSQCSIAEIINKNKAGFTAPYKYDGFNYSQIEFGLINQTLKKEFIAFKGQKYQLLFCTSGFEETVRITVRDIKDNSLVAGTTVGKESTVWSFFCSKTGTYSIEYEIPPSDTDVAHKGCIAMLIGFSEK
jgi:hypothetical protein